MRSGDPGYQRLVLKYKAVARQYAARFSDPPPLFVADPEGLAKNIRQMVERLRIVGEDVTEINGVDPGGEAVH